MKYLLVICSLFLFSHTSVAADSSIKLPKEVKGFMDAFCKKSISCGDKITKEECLHFVTPPYDDPEKKPKIDAAKDQFKACQKAVEKASCEAIQKEAPAECKFLDDFDSQ